MNDKSKAWIEKWSKRKYERMYPDFHVRGYGSDYEGATTFWMSTLVDPIGDRFAEGVKLHDYGCGCARLFNFMTGHLKDFTYYGTEPEGSAALVTAREYFDHDPRAIFMSCEEAVKSKEVMGANAVILGSIFTHLRQDDCEKILASLLPVVDHGGAIVFTAIFRPEAYYDTPGAHGFSNCYRISFLKGGWIEEMQEKFKCNIERVDFFETGHGVIHKVFRVE